jgi:hypothetical protein
MALVEIKGQHFRSTPIRMKCVRAFTSEVCTGACCTWSSCSPAHQTTCWSWWLLQVRPFEYGEVSLAESGIDPNGRNVDEAISKFLTDRVSCCWVGAGVEGRSCTLRALLPGGTGGSSPFPPPPFLLTCQPPLSHDGLP